MRYIFLTTVCFLQFSAWAAGAEITGNDITRIFYASNNPQQFLVLEKILPDGQLSCRYLNQNKRRNFAVQDLRKTYFFESSTPLFVTQHALYLGISDTPAMRLANLFARDSYRMQLLKVYQKARDRHLDRLNAAIRKADSIKDADDRREQFHGVLDEFDLDKIILKAVDAQDWILALTLMRDYNYLLNNITRYEKNKGSLHVDAETKREDITKALLFELENYLEKNTDRRKRFASLYPGLQLTVTVPKTLEDAWELHKKSLKAYFKLDQLSSTGDPQQWGIAMLDALLLIEKNPLASALVKEFDDEIAQLEKSPPDKTAE